MRHKQTSIERLSRISDKLNVLRHHINSNNRKESTEVIEEVKERLEDVISLITSESETR